VTGGWRKLHNEELHNLYSSPNITEINQGGLGHVACIGEVRNACKRLTGNPEGKRPLRRPSHRQEENIKIDLRERGLEGVDWIDLAQDRESWQAFVNMVLNLWVPQNSRHFLTR
jgi:hypothetical protein